MPTQATIKRNRRKWRKALRSGDYKQVRGHLFWGGRFCCLGVACVVLKPDADRRNHPWRDEEQLNGIGMMALGLSSSAHDRLAEANDNGVPFPEIADLIEALPITGASDG